MKVRIEELGIFGGFPAFKEKLHVGRPNIGDRERLFERLNDILDRRWLTNAGPQVREFEQRITEITGVKHCIAMCNGTVALEIAIRALELSGEVIVPSFTFVATAHALQWQEITPVFCDIDPDTCTIDPAQIEGLITPRTTAIVGVHLWGRVCEVEDLARIAWKHNLKLLFDAAHAFGSSYKGQLVGGFGDAEVFSFHATKVINTFEGGSIVTNSDSLAHKIRLMKNFGFVTQDRVNYIGTNGKMSEVAAAMGLTSLDAMDEFISVNYRNYKLYQQELAEVPGVRLLSFDERERCNYQYIVLESDDRVTSINRDHLAEVLRRENILVRRYFYPGCHNMEPYRSYFPNADLLLPETERLMEKVLCLPTGTAVSPQDIHRVCEVIRFVLAHGQDISEKLTLTEKALVQSA